MAPGGLMVLTRIETFHDFMPILDLIAHGLDA
jgi:hypothetical protein